MAMRPEAVWSRERSCPVTVKVGLNGMARGGEIVPFRAKSAFMVNRAIRAVLETWLAKIRRFERFCVAWKHLFGPKRADEMVKTDKRVAWPSEACDSN